MTRSKLYLLIFAAVLLEVTVFGRLEILGARPDIAFAIVVFAGLFSGAGRGLEAGIVAGLTNDIFALDYFGMNAVLMGLAGCLAGILGPKVYRESPLTQWMVVFTLSAMSMAVHFYAASILSEGSLRLTTGEYALHSIVPAGLYTSLVSVPLLSRIFASYRAKELEDLL